MAVEEHSDDGRRLDPEDVEAIARRVADLMDRASVAADYLDTAAVARRLRVSEEWVRNHAAELGAIRVGDGPRGALRFDARLVEQALEQRRLPTPARRRTARRRPPRVGGVRLLPLPEAR